MNSETMLNGTATDQSTHWSLTHKYRHRTLITVTFDTDTSGIFCRLKAALERVHVGKLEVFFFLFIFGFIPELLPDFIQLKLFINYVLGMECGQAKNVGGVGGVSEEATAILGVAHQNKF